MVRLHPSTLTVHLLVDLGPRSQNGAHGNLTAIANFASPPHITLLMENIEAANLTIEDVHSSLKNIPVPDNERGRHCIPVPLFAQIVDFDLLLKNVSISYHYLSPLSLYEQARMDDIIFPHFELAPIFITDGNGVKDSVVLFD